MFICFRIFFKEIKFLGPSCWDILDYTERYTVRMIVWLYVHSIQAVVGRYVYCNPYKLNKQ